MFRYLFFVFLIVFNYVHAEENTRVITVGFELKEPYQEKNGTLEFAHNIELVNIPGRSKIPYKVVTVLAKASDLNIDIDLGNEITYHKSRPELVSLKRYKCGQDVFIEGHKGKYYKNNETPLYEIEELGDFRGAPITRVLLYPLSYNQKEEITYFYPEIKFHINSKNDTDISFNYEKLIKNLNQRFLIISPERFIDNMTQYVDYKLEQGYQVDVRSMEALGDDFIEIKKSLHDLYQNERTKYSYILLVGHENMFPTEYVETSSNHNTPSDYNYFNFGGEKDLIPDVFYARLTIKDVFDIEKQISKFIEFEHEHTYANSIIGISSNEGDDPTDKELMDEILYPYEGFYNVFKLNQNERESNPNNLIKMFNENLRWVYYLGHGTGTSWSSFYGDSSFNSLHMRKLKENTSKPILIDISCSNGRFSINRFGERFLNTNSRSSSSTGIVSYFGGTDRISWIAPAVMGQGISRGAEFSKTLGEAIFRGKIYLLNNYSDLSEIRDTFTWFHLQGDPTLDIHN